MEWFAIMAPALSAIVVTVIEGIAHRERQQTKTDRAKTERRAADRAEESRLSMEMMSATCALSLVTAKKLSGQKTNGDVEESMRKANIAQGEYDKFLKDVASKQIAKK